jgi:heme iron utilization protein
VFETVASQHGVTPRAAVEALPTELWRLACIHRGDARNRQMGDVTLIIHTDDGIVEFTGRIPAGQYRLWRLDWGLSRSATALSF